MDPPKRDSTLENYPYAFLNMETFIRFLSKSPGKS